MNLSEDGYLYDTLSLNEKEILGYISNIIKNITHENEINILKETLYINSDEEDWWYSYTVVVDCDENTTAALNNVFVDALVAKNYILDIENKIISRLETGASSGD